MTTHNDDGNFSLSANDVEANNTQHEQGAIFMTGFRAPNTEVVTSLISERPGMRRVSHQPTARYRERSQFEDEIWHSTGTRHYGVLRPTRRR
ncbi:hypothetical protein SAMN05216266_12753 [Amycolatopsis marina]|uniref:Uncharacterized protein n=1 Tax=Amycolatopsis marina TaxID=490629 RepID=A0A1I1CL78_9PSEU|nr:hypothetical protein [Amycolatopsis marina]SFB61183.1 hypothetical protein SAMN05216266_12753 [Amycolatopsis marina]